MPDRAVGQLTIGGLITAFELAYEWVGREPQTQDGRRRYAEDIHTLNGMFEQIEEYRRGTS